ncbi:glycoside hydrolase superfamily [Cladochytrium replicatum]|nr:glycoside hydrolase superfamily [Cladochytrium replicatum]
MLLRTAVSATLAFLVAAASSASAQFVTGRRPLCTSAGTPSTVFVNCTNFAPETGVMAGFNVDLDGHDTIAAFKNRMNPWTNSPALYGMFMKIAQVLIGQTPLDSRKEDLDTFITQIRGQNAMFVVSIDPWYGYNNVSDEAVSLFALKMQELNQYGIPVLIRPAHEMNAPWYPYGMQPTAFKDFYRKIHRAVRAVAPYTRFIYAPNLGTGYPWTIGDYHIKPTDPDFPLADTNNNKVLDTNDDPYTPYYPGDEYVDWFGCSTYWKGEYPYNNNQVVPDNFILGQMSQVLGGGLSTLQWAQRRNLPIIFPEMAGSFTAANPGVPNIQTKQKFWQQIYSPAGQAVLPGLKAGLWFDYVKFEDNALRDFSISSNRNGTLAQVAPSFKSDLGGYGTGVVWAANMAMPSAGAACGCFVNNEAKQALADWTPPPSPSPTTTTTRGPTATALVQGNTSDGAVGPRVAQTFLVASALGAVVAVVGALFV